MPSNPMNRRVVKIVAGLSMLVLVVTGCGDDDGAIADPPDADRPEYTAGYDVDFETGDVDVSSYASFLAEHGPPSTGPEGAALELLNDPYNEDYEGGDAIEPSISFASADGGRTVVSVTYEGLMDDSVAAERIELVFIGEGDGLTIESGSWAIRCHEGRGHQDFDVGPCL